MLLPGSRAPLPPFGHAAATIAGFVVHHTRDAAQAILKDEQVGPRHSRSGSRTLPPSCARAWPTSAPSRSPPPVVGDAVRV